MITNVAEWPRVQVRVTDTGGEVSIGGAKAHQVHGQGIVAVRSAALAVVAVAAADLGRGLRVEATDPGWTFYLIVRPNGKVEADPARPPHRHSTPPPGPAPEAAPVLVVETPPEGGEAGGLIPALGARRARLLVPALMAGAGVVAFAGGWLLNGALGVTPEVVEASSAEVDAAETAWQERRSNLDQAIEDAGSVLTATEGQVSDEATRSALAAQLAAANAFRSAMTDVEPPVIASREGEDVALAPDAEWDPGYSAMAQGLTNNAGAVEASHAQWSYDALNATVQAANTVLADSNGQVTDTSTRDVLSAALTTGQALLDAGAEDAEASELAAAAAAITTAQGGVEGSRAQWVYDALSNRVSEARGVLNASDGQVPDNAVRDALFLAIGDAQRILDAGPGGASPADTLAAREAVNAAAGAVQAATTQPQG